MSKFFLLDKQSISFSADPNMCICTICRSEKIYREHLKIYLITECTFDLLCTNLKNLYLLQNHFRVIRRWNFESIDLYLWKLPIFFLGLFWIVPYHLYCWVHTMAIIAKFCPNIIMIICYKRQKTAYNLDH